MDAALVLGQRLGRDPRVELVGVGHALPEHLVECREAALCGAVGQAQAEGLASAGRDVDGVMGRRLRPGLRGIHRAAVAANDIAMERVLHVRRRVRLPPEPLRVALVLREQQVGAAVAREHVLAQFGMRGQDAPLRMTQVWLGSVIARRPGVPEPQCGQQVQLRRLRAAVVRRDADQDVLGPGLGVLDEHVEVPVVVEDPRVEQFVLEVVPGQPAVGFDEVAVRVFALRILVQVLHVRVRGRRVDVEVVLLHVLAVVPLAVREAEHPLLENGIAPVPQRQREAETLPVVRDAAEAVLTPPIGPRTGLIVGEVVPGVAVLAVVLAHGAPLALAQVRPPLLPGDAGFTRVVEPLLLRDVDETGGLGRFRRWRPVVRHGSLFLEQQCVREAVTLTPAGAPSSGSPP